MKFCSNWVCSLQHRLWTKQLLIHFIFIRLGARLYLQPAPGKASQLLGSLSCARLVRILSTLSFAPPKARRMLLVCMLPGEPLLVCQSSRRLTAIAWTQRGMREPKSASTISACGAFTASSSNYPLSDIQEFHLTVQTKEWRLGPRSRQRVIQHYLSLTDT